MKKQLLILACAAALMPTVDAVAQVSVNQKWSMITRDLHDGWPTIPGIGSTPNKTAARFATASNGKIYTIDMNAQTIVSLNGLELKTEYAIPATDLTFGETDGRDYYGTAISCDNAGNFLLGHRFTKPESQTVWTVFRPATNDVKTFVLPVSGASRTDCVGRVIGDLTKDAIFYVAPQYNGQPSALMVHVTGDGTVASTEATVKTSYPLSTVSTNQSIAQPMYATVDETLAAAYPENSFFFTTDGKSPILSFNDGTEKVYDIVSNMRVNGFDTFELGGKRYFVRSYTDAETAPWGNTPSFGVFDADGSVVASWLVPGPIDAPEFFSSAGYATIVAEVVDATTVNVYVYCITSNFNGEGANCDAAFGAMFELQFDLAALDKGSGTEADPYQISTPADLVKMRNQVSNATPTYFKLMNDIDMSGINYIPAVGAGNTDFGKTIHFDGNYHVIKNLTSVSDPGGFYYASLFGVFDGSVKNLGVENCYCYSELGAGVIGAYLGYSGKPCVVDNVWATGNVECVSGYAGGIGGNIGGPTTITNSYSQVNVVAKNFGGGIVGRVRDNVTIKNVYAAGTVAAETVGGIIAASGNDNAYTVELADVIAWNASLTGSAKAEAVNVINATVSNALYWDGMTVNGTAVTGGSTAATLESTAKGWSAYADQLLDGKPALAWQLSGSVEGIEIDVPASENAAPVYYNLQGVKVENPANGLYIVKRGNKVTKEIIR